MSKLRILRQRLSKILMSVFVCFIFVLPIYFSGRWLLTILDERDPRRVFNAPALQTREVDKYPEQLRPFQEPVVSIAFDDGWESIYTHAFPLLQKYGVLTTQYIISNTFDNRSYMSIAQIQSMQKAGHEVGSHTVSHADLTTLDEAALAFELSVSKDTLSKHFGPIKDFTSPYGAYNAYTLETIRKHYRSQRSAEGDRITIENEPINIAETFDPINIRSFSVRNDTTLSDIQKLISDSQARNGWLVLTYHQIDYSGDLYSVTPENFEAQLALLANSTLRVMPVGAFLDKAVPLSGGSN